MATTINADNGAVSGSAGLKSSADSSGVLALQTNGTTAVTVDASQNVGVGATTAALTTVANRTYLAIKGTGTAAGDGLGVLQLQTNAAGSTLPNMGNIEWSLPDNSSSSSLRVSYITSSAEGTTANNRGSVMAFATKSDGVSGAGTERMRIDSSGRVLIGNTSTYSFSGISPNLQVTDDSITNVDADGGTLALFGNSAFAINSGAGLAFGYTYNTGLYVSGARVRGAKENATAGNYAGYLGFDTRANGGNFTEKMRIDSSGNVGIGTTTPDIYSQGGKMLTVSNTATNSYSWLTLVGSGTGGGELDFGNQTIRHAAIASLTGSSLAFYTNSTNSGTAVSQRMIIDSAGNVGIGSSPLTSSYRLTVTGGRSAFQSNSDQYAVYVAYNSSTNGGFIGSPSADAIAFSKANGTETARIDSSGNLLVGTTSSTPSAPFGGVIFAGTFRTIVSNGTVATSASATLFTITVDTAYFVTVQTQNAGGLSTTAIVRYVTGGNPVATTTLYADNAAFAVTVSGTAVRITNTLGGTVAYSHSSMRIY